MTFSRRRPKTFVVVAVALATLLPGCRRTSKIEGEGRLDPNGRVVLTRDDKPATVTGSRSLETGDAVEVGDGSAKITLPGGDVLELRPRSILVMLRGPDLRSGNVLVTTTGRPRTVRAAGSQVDASGATRLDVTLALRVVSYGGRAVVRSGGRTLEVPALREASVPVVGVLRGPRPIAIDGADVWDRRFLGDAAAKESELESLARGFTGQVARANATSPAYYRSVLTGLNAAEFRQAEVDRLGRAAVDTSVPAADERFRAGDVLVGAAVALQGRRGTFADRLAGISAFRSEGASWGLICLDQQVPSIEALLRLVDGAVNAAPLELAAPGTRTTTPAGEPPPARPTTTTTVPGARTTPTTSTTVPGPTGTTPRTTPLLPAQQQQPPPPSPPPLVLPVVPLLDTVVDPVAKLLNDLLGNNAR